MPLQENRVDPQKTSMVVTFEKSELTMDFPSKYELQVTVPEKGVPPSLACACPGASIGHCEKMLDYDEP